MVGLPDKTDLALSGVSFPPTVQALSTLCSAPSNHTRLQKVFPRLKPGAPIGTPIDARMPSANKNEKGLHDWSTFNVR